MNGVIIEGRPIKIVSGSKVKSSSIQFRSDDKIPGGKSVPRQLPPPNAGFPTCRMMKLGEFRYTLRTLQRITNDDQSVRYPKLQFYLKALFIHVVEETDQIVVQAIQKINQLVLKSVAQPKPLSDARILQLQVLLEVVSSFRLTEDLNLVPYDEDNKWVVPSKETLEKQANLAQEH